MNNFSNEPKKRKEVKKAILKTIVKRYSFIVWLPMLLYIFNKVGKWMICIIQGIDYEGYIIVDTMLGFCISIMLVAFALLIGALIEELIKDLIKYLKENTIKTICIKIKENLKETILFIIKGIIWIIKIPKKIFLIIISEPERFKYSLQKEINKKTKKNDETSE